MQQLYTHPWKETGKESKLPEALKQDENPSFG